MPIIVTPDDSEIVGIRADVTRRVRRLLRMREVELNLSRSQYIAALIIADTKHLGSVTETEEQENDDGGKNAA